MNEFTAVVTAEEEIRDIIGYPSELVNHKIIDHIDNHCSDFIAKTPLLFISTSDGQGSCDVSPRGDAPGFVAIMDNKRLLIPERPGNRRIDSIRNILNNPHVGLIFIIPGLEETLRINGRAYVIKDKSLLEPMHVNGKAPLLGIGVVVEECYMHCAKAFKRSRTWEPESWLDEGLLPKPAKIIAAHARQLNVTEEAVEASLHETYTKRLY